METECEGHHLKYSMSDDGFATVEQLGEIYLCDVHNTNPPLTEDTVQRRELDAWFDARGLRPRIAGEFEDSALMKVFGQAGAGFFPVPAVIQDEVASQYGVVPIGTAQGVVERYFAISVERRVRHPAVAAICATARSELFA